MTHFFPLPTLVFFFISFYRVMYTCIQAVTDSKDLVNGNRYEVGYYCWDHNKNESFQTFCLILTIINRQLSIKYQLCIVHRFQNFNGKFRICNSLLCTYMYTG